MISSLIILTTYGKLTDEYVFWAEKSLEAASKALVPGAYWVEFLPFLRHVPRWLCSMGHHKLVEEYRPSVLNLLEKPFADTEVAVVSYCIPFLHSICADRANTDQWDCEPLFCGVCARRDARQFFGLQCR